VTHSTIDSDTFVPRPPPTLLVATGNAHKVQEISALLRDAAGSAAFLCVIDSGSLPPGPPIVEDGETFEANARIKAHAFARRALALPPTERPDWLIADDSGLCVDALKGAPGVHSARYAGEDASDADNNSKLLQALDGVPEGERRAEFVCTIACGPVPKDDAAFNVEFVVEGRCEGYIIQGVASDRGKGSGGFGYDPLFFVPELGKTFAEVPQTKKNTRSHRGRALTRLWEQLSGRVLKQLAPERDAR